MFKKDIKKIKNGYCELNYNIDNADWTVKTYKIIEEKVFINYQNIGNTVSATIPIALCDAAKEKKLKAGDQVMLVGFGVGYSWGGCIIQWDPET